MNEPVEKDTFRQVIAKRRGGRNRARILSELNDRPRNTHRLAEQLNLDYKTVNHHLETLVENGLLQCSGNHYGAVYLLSDQAQHHWGLVREIIDSSEFEDI
jgi:DNA-binding transcriptional ArsR family regulator